MILENVFWIKREKSEKERLLMGLEGYRELEEMLKNEDIEVRIGEWQDQVI
ncbi:MAG: hypothetical protein L3J75_06725 [Methylococcaceae bacterium]|nr:hypothetical protein [Methylococcaceae bacterium]